MNFQRITGAEEFYRGDFGVVLFDGVANDDRVVLEEVFCKRHVLTHNLGLVDEKYKRQAGLWTRAGAEVPVEKDDVVRAISVVEKVIKAAATLFGV